MPLFQVTGKCSSVMVRLIPAPRGTGIVSAPVPKKLLQMAGIEVKNQFIFLEKITFSVAN